MTIPVQITFRHMESSQAVETRVRELANHLGVFSDRITSCRVVVDSPVLSEGKFQSLLALDDPGYAHERIDLNYPEASSLKQALAAVCELAAR